MRNSLREATGDVHQRLHEAAPFAAIARRELGIAGYTELLGRIAAFHLTVSPALRLDPARPQLLTSDLEWLGAPLPPPVQWDAPPDEPGRLGWSYVVEGSMLGGKLIYRQLDYLFGASSEGRRFFAGSPSDKARWRSLCERLQHAGEDLAAREAIIAGARHAFALFERLVAPQAAHA